MTERVSNRLTSWSVDGSRRALDWSEAEVDSIRSLSPAQRARIGAAWKFRTRQEHLAVGAFSQITHELAEAGVDPLVLAITTRAASDEVRHYAICHDYAVLFLGDDAMRGTPSGTPKPSVYARLATHERALLHVLEMCCFNETFTGIYFAELHARSTSPFARSVVDSLLEDEIHHGRVGWTHLSNACREGWAKKLVETHLEEILVRALDPVMEGPRKHPEKDDAAMEAHAFLGGDTGAKVYSEGLRDVILPGLDEVGIDTRAIRQVAQDRHYL